MRHVMDETGRRAHRGRRHPQVGERIPGVGIGPVLADDDVRPERGGDLGEQRGDRRTPRAFAGPRLQGHVDRGSGGGPLARFVDGAGPREQVPAGLVDRQGQHTRVVPVDGLDAVAVMDVEVDVQDAQTVASRSGDGQRRVVVDAEPGRAVGHRVVEASARVERVLDVAAQDRLHRPDRAARDRRCGVVHPRERRIVAARPDPRLGEPVRIAARSA